MTHVVTYNGISFNEVETKRFGQDLVYDESNTDLLYHKFRIRIAGSVHANQLAFHRTTVDGVTESTATTTMAEIHSVLMHPRQEFNYVVNGETLLRANANKSGAALDVNNGPKPLSCDITEIYGSKLYRVEFEIEIARVLCGIADAEKILQSAGGALRNANVLSNRWSVADQKDGNFFTTRTIEGVLRVSHIDSWPHIFRFLCVPPLSAGYRRESMRFADSPDGLVLRYQIVDRQRFRAPPVPATDWEATYVESTGEGGAIGFGEMRIKLYGGPASDTFKLLEAAAQVLFQRLGDITKTYEDTGQGEHSVILKHLAIAEVLHSNEIELNARIQRASSQQRFLNATVQQIGEPLDIPGYDQKRWPVPKLYDSTSPSGMFAKYLQSACVDVHGIPQPLLLAQQGDDDPGTDDTDEQTVADFFDDPEPIEDDDDTGVSQEQREGGFPYTHYLVENRYETKGGYAQLPIARWTLVPSGNPTAALIPLHQAIAKRHVFIMAERVGDWPELPDPVSRFIDANGITLVLQDFEPLFESPELLPDGKSRLFKSQARYVYLMSRPPTSEELLGTGADPRDESLPEENAFPGSLLFSQGKIL